jgi:acyl carrier protein
MTLRALLADCLATSEAEIPTDCPIGELGIDSLTAAEISVTVEERCGVLIALERFLGSETVEELERELRVAA